MADANGFFNCSPLATIDPLTGSAVFASISGVTLSPILPGYTYALLPASSTAGAMARVTDEANAVYMYDGAAWQPLGNQLGRHTQLGVLPTPTPPDSTNLVSIGPATTQAIFEMYATNYRSDNTSTGMQLRPTLYPAYSFVGALGTGGDAMGINLNPIIHINTNSKSGANRTAHKWTASAWIEAAQLVFDNPDYTLGTGLPQEYAVIHIANNNGLTQAVANRGVWSLQSLGGLPSDHKGALWLNSVDMGVNPLHRIKQGGYDSTAHDLNPANPIVLPTYHTNVLRIDATLGPSSDVTVDPERSAWALYSTTSIITDTGGQHDDLGNAYFLTPTLKTGGTADLLNFTTVRIGNAPAVTAWAATTAYTVGLLRSNGGRVYTVTVAGTSAGAGGPTGTGTGIVDGTVTWDYVSNVPVTRALWAGTGKSEIEGNLYTGGYLLMGANTSNTSGAGNGDIVLPNNTGQILFNNAANTANFAALRTDTSNRLAFAEGYSEVIMAGTFLRFNEVSAPSVASANEVRVYAVDNGSGNTQLCGVFNTGSVNCFAGQGNAGTLLSVVLQAALGTPPNGTILYCSDCNTASACTAGGTGALAIRQAAGWKCP